VEVVEESPYRFRVPQHGEMQGARRRLQLPGPAARRQRRPLARAGAQRGDAAGHHGRVLRSAGGTELRHELEAQGIAVRGASARGLAEAAPAAYKDVAAVIEATEGGGLGRGWHGSSRSES
jgi:hypothetical protein